MIWIRGSLRICSRIIPFELIWGPRSYPVGILAATFSKASCIISLDWSSLSCHSISNVYERETSSLSTTRRAWCPFPGLLGKEGWELTSESSEIKLCISYVVTCFYSKLRALLRWWGYVCGPLWAVFTFYTISLSTEKLRPGCDCKTKQLETWQSYQDPRVVETRDGHTELHRR